MRTTIPMRHFISMPMLIVWMYLASISATTFANSWKSLQPGIEYRDESSNFLSPWSHIHIFKIDLHQYQFDLVTAQTLSKSLASVNEFGDTQHALIAINGGFFDENSHPLGLRIGHHRQYQSLKPISWWGIFYIQNQTAHITHYRHFPKDAAVSFAIQSGPRLLIHRRIVNLKEGIAERTALGITADHQVIILVTEHFPMTTYAVAHLMKTKLHCLDALNLDGGSSSQLFAQIGNFKINAYGFSNVSDAILIKPITD